MPFHLKFISCFLKSKDLFGVSHFLAICSTAGPYLFVNGNAVPHTSALARFAEPFAAVEPESLTSRAGPAKPKASSPVKMRSCGQKRCPWG